MKLDVKKAGTAAALLFGSSVAFGAALGPVESGSAGYVGSGGLVVNTGTGDCLRTSDFGDDNMVNACEGIEEAAAPAPAAAPEATTVAEPVKAEPTIVPIARSIRADFASGSAVPTAEGEAEISAMIAELSQLQEIVSIEISGHSDSRGSAAFNQTLSEKRAETVRDRMQAAFPNASVTYAGFGESQPIASNDSPEGRAQNRRVDIVVNARSVQN